MWQQTSLDFELKNSVISVFSVVNNKKRRPVFTGRQGHGNTLIKGLLHLIYLSTYLPEPWAPTNSG